MDDSTDATDMTQLAIFSRGLNDKYNVTDEMASLVPLKGEAKSRDLYEAVKNMLKWLSLSIINISGIVTDGALAMVGKREGLAKLTEDNAIAAPNSHLMKYHCIIHQENVCTKALKMDNVVQIIIKTVNFITVKGLNHRQFQEFLKYWCWLWWHHLLFQNKMAKLRPNVEKILWFAILSSHLWYQKNKFVPEHDNENWLTHLAFLVDLITHLNELNMCLQDENQLINTMF